jgi:polysaccharide pyruvyl transferase WcaK-like protein
LFPYSLRQRQRRVSGTAWNLCKSAKSKKKKKKRKKESKKMRAMPVKAWNMRDSAENQQQLGMSVKA